MLYTPFPFEQQQFFPPVKLCRYNMFNHHFFDGASAKESYTAFLRGDGLDDPGDLFIAMDPPFGGLIDALVFNLKRIWDDSQAVNCTGKLPECFNHAVKS